MASIKSIIKSRMAVFYGAIIYLVIAAILILLSWNFVEMRAMNYMTKNFNASNLKNSDTVLIVIDDKSVARYRWPWKRELYAQLFEYLNTYSKTKAVSFDAIIASNDLENLNSDKKLFSKIKNIDNLAVGFMPSWADAQSIPASKEYLNKFAKKFAVNVKDERNNKYTTGLTSMMSMPDGYFNSIKHTGSVFTLADNVDGYQRRFSQLQEINGKFYPSLALSIYLMENKTDSLILKDNVLIIPKTGLKIPGNYTPWGFLSYTKFYKIKYNEMYSHKNYSAIDIMDSLTALKQGKLPKINPHEFDGKTVFIGANSTATAIGLADVTKTPMLENHSGADLQAVNFDNIRNNEFIRVTSLLQDLTFILLVGLVIFALIYNFSFIISLVLIIILCVLYYLAAILAYKHNFSVNVITPLFIVLWTMVYAYSYRFIIEGKNKEKIKNAMGKYLSQDIMKNVVKNIDDIKLGGKKANVTVLFADIRGFTSMSEKMTAEDVSVILNEYFTEIEPIIASHHGVINKFIGDAVMAIFGEPIQDINHPENAVRCAYDMLLKVEELREKWLKEGKPKIEIGIGINTGETFVGNIGSEKRLEYTVIGDTVNLASRIENYNKVYKSNFLISSSTYNEVSSIVDVVKISDVQIRGKEKKMDIYEVLKVM